MSEFAAPASGHEEFQSMTGDEASGSFGGGASAEPLSGSDAAGDESASVLQQEQLLEQEDPQLVQALQEQSAEAESLAQSDPQVAEEIVAYEEQELGAVDPQLLSELEGGSPAQEPVQSAGPEPVAQPNPQESLQAQQQQDAEEEQQAQVQQENLQAQQAEEGVEQQAVQDEEQEALNTEQATTQSADEFDEYIRE